ncbi:MAG: hypothetical protein A2W00_04800 [Candidatus Eisenbacteria bacterium RBG_16_71_46]|nr:MAG: hypothetical protein A2W00_04800 [Candidatus Eisenbacteria bacterium RBG_16_71_46]OGF24758.1 MAG: hypothetical protein A2V63_00620 [Candidatus Eisenbacteria bacterium RBG_19FT_COMBO_70_11]
MRFKAAILGVTLVVFGAGVANAAGTVWLGANAGAGFPTGTYADAASTGWNLGLTGVRMVNDNWGIGADVAYHAWGASDELKLATEALFGPGSEFHWSAIQATGNAMYRFPTTSNAKPYAKVGVGLYDLSAKLTSPMGDESTTKSKLGFNFGGGMHVMTTGNQMWGINGTYHLIPASEDFGADWRAFSLGVSMMWGVNNR